MWLERAFPGYHLSPKEEKEKPSPEVQHVKKRNVRNLAIKFGLDQIVGSTLNTYLFIAAFAAFRNQGVLQACKDQFWPMRIAALKVWPMVRVPCRAGPLAPHNIHMLKLLCIIAGCPTQLYGAAGAVSHPIR